MCCGAWNTGLALRFTQLCATLDNHAVVKERSSGLQAARLARPPASELEFQMGTVRISVYTYGIPEGHRAHATHDEFQIAAAQGQTLSQFPFGRIPRRVTIAG